MQFSAKKVLAFIRRLALEKCIYSIYDTFGVTVK